MFRHGPVSAVGITTSNPVEAGAGYSMSATESPPVPAPIIARPSGVLASLC